MKIISLVVGLTVGVLLMVGLVSPVVLDGQTTAGPTVTMTNETAITLKEIDSGDVLHAYIDNDAKKLTLNGEEITALADLEFADALVISDKMYMQINPGEETNFVYLSNLSTAGAVTWSDCTIEFTANSIHFYGTSSIGPIDETQTYTWGYVICNPSDGEYCASVSGGSGYVNTTNDVILCGMYLSGENDTPYYYKNGVFTTSQWEGTKSVNIDMVKVTNTTDIYTATVDVDIGEETFTPYRIYLPLEVVGHSPSGANYALLGAIPIVAFIALIAFAAYAVNGRMND